MTSVAFFPSVLRGCGEVESERHSQEGVGGFRTLRCSPEVEWTPQSGEAGDRKQLGEGRLGADEQKKQTRLEEGRERKVDGREREERGGKRKEKKKRGEKKAFKGIQG